jgi:NAD(P)-dependent dehydrogenase (short-subunit alcohol dehydrogenase family)
MTEPGTDARVVLVTGAGRGIGRASALLLSDRGWRVAAVDLKHDGPPPPRLDAGGPLVLEADVTDEQSIGGAVEATLDRFGRLDAIFANAASMAFGALLDTSPEEWRRMLEINVTGVYSTIRKCLPAIIASGGGAVLATSSDAAIRTTSGTAAYVTSKHAVIGLIRSIAVDYGDQGVRANVLMPGVTDTPGVREVYSSPGKTPSGSLAKAAALSPLGRTADPSDIANAAAFLLSDDAAFITGASLVVDGGMTVTYGAD